MHTTKAAFPTVQDDPRWISPFPLRPELQLRYLYLQAIDALDVAAFALRVRTSPVGVGAVRFLTECHVLVCFLTEVTGSERQKRAYRLIQSGIDRVRKIGARTHGMTGREADEAERWLAQFAREDGVQHVKAAPDREYLFKKYLQPGYVVFATLSELGSHPGFLHIVPFFADPKTNVINVNLTGAPLDRALWIALGFEMFGRVTDNVGTAYGWADWLQSDVIPIVQRGAPLMTEIRTRWDAKWERLMEKRADRPAE